MAPARGLLYLWSVEARLEPFVRRAVPNARSAARRARPMEGPSKNRRERFFASAASLQDAVQGWAAQKYVGNKFSRAQRVCRTRSRDGPRNPSPIDRAKGPRVGPFEFVATSDGFGPKMVNKRQGSTRRGTRRRRSPKRGGPPERRDPSGSHGRADQPKAPRGAFVVPTLPGSIRI
jgi:hypothetical protein